MKSFRGDSFADSYQGNRNRIKPPIAFLSTVKDRPHHRGLRSSGLSEYQGGFFNFLFVLIRKGEGDETNQLATTPNKDDHVLSSDKSRSNLSSIAYLKIHIATLRNANTTIYTLHLSHAPTTHYGKVPPFHNSNKNKYLLGCKGAFLSEGRGRLYTLRLP